MSHVISQNKEYSVGSHLLGQISLNLMCSSVIIFFLLLYFSHTIHHTLEKFQTKMSSRKTNSFHSGHFMWLILWGKIVKGFVTNSRKSHLGQHVVLTTDQMAYMRNPYFSTCNLSKLVDHWKRKMLVRRNVKNTGWLILKCNIVRRQKSWHVNPFFSKISAVWRIS